MGYSSTFTFQSEHGTFTARKERAGSRRGGEYWKAYRSRHGKLYRTYLGKSEELTLEQLQSVATVLASDMRTEGDQSDRPGHLSYGSLLNNLHQTANLLADLGVESGEVIALLLPNLLETHLLLWGGQAAIDGVFGTIK